jgi:hypothetical protein
LGRENCDYIQYLIFYKTIIIYQIWVFGFMRIGVINPKNRLGLV